MRNPNGYGTVIRLKGNRRRPYMVRVTTGWEKAEDHMIQKFAVLGYFTKKTDAITCLADYNKCPYNTDMSKYTFKEVYEGWSKDAFPKLQDRLIAVLKAAYNTHCTDLYDQEYRLLRKHDFQAVLDKCNKSYSTKCSIRNLFTKMDAWAYDHDIIVKSYVMNLDVGEQSASKMRDIFTDEEVRKLFTLSGTQYVDDTIVQLYTGFRISELLALTDDSIDLEQNIITGGGKTESGKNRIVPIHPDILPIIKAHMGTGGKLFQITEKSESYYLTRRKQALEQLGFRKHDSHECRHTFRSKLDSAGANKVSIDLLMGHKSTDVGERVYTHKTIEELRNTIMLLNYKSCE